MSIVLSVAASIAEEKENLRRKVRQMTKRMSLSEKFKAGREIYIKLFSLPEFRRVRTLHVYITSFPWEIPTIPLIQYMFNKNGKVIIPAACPRDADLSHYPITQIDKLRRGCYNVWEPELLDRTEIDPAEADLIIVPGKAFDRTGNRLGFGTGYYDRFLTHMDQPKIALAYKFLVFPEIPADELDQKVDMIITEDEIIR